MFRRSLRRALTGVALASALTLGSVPAALAQPTTAATPQPASSCAASISMPSKVVIDRSYREVKVTLKDPCKRISGSAYSYLYGKDGIEEVFLFSGGSRTEYWDVYDWSVTPGTFKTRDSSARDKNYKPVWVKETSTKAKYGTKSSLSTSRSGSKVTFSVSSTAYSPTYEAYRPWTAKKAVIQKKVGSEWRYFRTVPLSGGKGKISATASAKATYRVSVTEDWARWSNTSNTSTR